MTLSRAFTQTFDPVMKERGFQRKGVLYYRLNGEILQGIVLKTTNPFEICCAFFPYWTYSFRQICYELKSGHWAEIEEESFAGDYCRKETPEATLACFEKCLKLVEERFLPRLDCARDIDSYLETLMTAKREFLAQKRRNIGEAIVMGFTGKVKNSQPISAHALLRKAYLDGSFDSAEQIFQNYLQWSAECERVYAAYRAASSLQFNAANREVIIQDFAKTLLETCPEMSKEDAYAEARVRCAPVKENVDDLIEKNRKYLTDHLFAEYIARRDANDLSWICGIYEEECQKMQKSLQEELKLLKK